MNWYTSTTNDTSTAGNTITFTFTWQQFAPPPSLPSPSLAPMLNAYDILGIPRGSAPADCRRAYRRMAKLYHPDVIAGAEEKMVLLNRAYQLLKEQGLA